jgi:hypothetical protein
MLHLSRSAFHGECRLAVVSNDVIADGTVRADGPIAAARVTDWGL